MDIVQYFGTYNSLVENMQIALKLWVDAKEDFYYITGIQIDDMPKAKAEAKRRGLDSLMENIETLGEKYINLKLSCEDERKRCKRDIDKLESKLYRLIIEYAFLDMDKDKKILNTLKTYHNMDISYGYFRNSKSKAIKEFETLISTSM